MTIRGSARRTSECGRDPKQAVTPPPIGVGSLGQGDILLSLGEGDTSRAIQMLDGGAYSHAALWSGEKVIEATTPRVVERALAKSLRDHPRHYVDVYRFRDRRPDFCSSKIVDLARTYLKRSYPFDDLALLALLISVSTWVPKPNQVRLVEVLAGWVRDLREKPKGRPEFVTCVGLVVTSYALGGTPIRIEVTNPGRLDLVTMSKGVLDVVWGSKRGDPRGDVDLEWARLRADAAQAYLEIAGVDPSVVRETSIPWELGLRAPAPPEPYYAGKNWPANLVTPRYLQESPDLKPIGRLYPANEDPPP